MGACTFGILFGQGGSFGWDSRFIFVVPVSFPFYPFRLVAKCKFEIIIYPIYFAICGAMLILTLRQGRSVGACEPSCPESSAAGKNVASHTRSSLKWSAEY
jgi:hypothetical protein